MRFAVLIFILTGQALAQVPEYSIEPQPDGRTLTMNVRLAEEDFNPAGPVWWLETFSRSSTNYLRFHIRAFGADGNDDAVILVEGDGQELSYPVEDIGNDGLWTGLVPGGQAVISLVADTRPEDLVIEIDEMTFEAPTGTPFSTWGELQLMHVHDPDVPDFVRTLISPVASLFFQRDGLPRTCTGFLIGENTLLTNEHCINSADTCKSLTVVFGYERDASGQVRIGQQFKCAAFDPQQSSFELDATILQLSGTPSATYGRVEVPDPDASITGPLTIIQHPGGEPKQVSFIECSVMASQVDGRGPETDFTHTCDTAGGSSGSPVFNAQGRLIGLHHYGFAEGHIEEWDENRGVRFTRIREWLKSHSGDGP
ncbi:trypsin-like serine peptidase [Mesorhizobium sp. f-mel]